MNKYGLTSIKAAKLVDQGFSPSDAWEKASCEFFERGSAAHKKGCPKNAFWGLYENDRVKLSKNALYAVKALEYLRKYPQEVISVKKLWNIATNGELISHNSQMNVVLELWKSGLIK